MVTVTGRHLDSVAKPRISVTVVVTRMLNNTMSRSTPALRNSEVLFFDTELFEDTALLMHDTDDQAFVAALPVYCLILSIVFRRYVSNYI